MSQKLDEIEKALKAAKPALPWTAHNMAGSTRVYDSSKFDGADCPQQVAEFAMLFPEGELDPESVLVCALANSAEALVRVARAADGVDEYWRAIDAGEASNMRIYQDRLAELRAALAALEGGA